MFQAHFQGNVLLCLFRFKWIFSLCINIKTVGCFITAEGQGCGVCVHEKLKLSYSILDAYITHLTVERIKKMMITELLAGGFRTLVVSMLSERVMVNIGDAC